jgi:hypothetical protein
MVKSQEVALNVPLYLRTYTFLHHQSSAALVSNNNRNKSSNITSTMEAYLTEKLLELQLRDDPSVTRNQLGDCLFLCFVHFLKGIQSLAKSVQKEGEKLLVFKPTHTMGAAARPVRDRARIDVSTAQGMRLLAADMAESMLNPLSPHPHTESLKKHIRHRFRSATIRARDAEVLGEDVLSDDATDEAKFESWCKLMRNSGANSFIQP